MGSSEEDNRSTRDMALGIKGHLLALEHLLLAQLAVLDAPQRRLVAAVFEHETQASTTLLLNEPHVGELLREAFEYAAGRLLKRLQHPPPP